MWEWHALGHIALSESNNPAPKASYPWDYVHITTLNFLPYLLKRVGVAPHWVIALTMAIWFVALAILIAVLIFLEFQGRRGRLEPSTCAAR